MSGGGYEIGLSASEAMTQDFATQFRPGDVSINTGGEKQSITLYIVVGVVALAAVLMVFLFRRR